MTQVHVSNSTDRDIVAQRVEGQDYVIAPGQGVDVPARTALILQTYGATLTQREQEKALRDDDAVHPVTEGETRFTGGREHRMDDDRANVAGTPVEITGDTGTTLVGDEPGRPAVKSGRRRGKVEPEVATGTQADAAAQQGITGGSTLTEADAQTPTVPVTGPEGPAAQLAAGMDLSWIDTLSGTPLDQALIDAGLEPTGKTLPDKRTELRTSLHERLAPRAR